MNKYLVNFIAIITLVGIAEVTHAEQQNYSLEAHVHGALELTIAMENDMLEIQLTSPAMNLVGFEHKVSTRENIEAVERAELQLGKHEALFLFSGRRCEHLNTLIDLSAIVETNTSEHSHAYRDEHSQQNSQPHSKQHSHEHSSHHSSYHSSYHNHQQHSAEYKHKIADQHKQESHTENGTHSEIVANYQYRCDSNSSLSSITVTLFKFFPNIHKVHAMWVNQAGQGAVTLTAKKPMINFG